MIEIVGSCERRIFGLAPAERLARQRGASPGPVLVADASAVLGDTTVGWLLENPGTIVTTPAGRPVAVAAAPDAVDAARAALAGTAQLPRINPATMDEMFVRKLRRRDRLLVRSVDEQPLPRVERELFDSVYKGVTDLVTKYAWPLPAFWVTRAAARLRIPPNAVTVVGILLMFLAAYLWLEAELWAGLAAAWGMTFLDTVDGKLARVTVTSSELGNLLDHVTDMIHPPLWWLCLAVGLAATSPAGELVWASCWVIIGTYVVGRVLEKATKARLGYNPFLWQRFDSRFRLIVSRRNIILLLMTIGLVVGQPVAAFAACAVWSVVSVVVQAVRYAQAVRATRAGASESWLM